MRGQRKKRPGADLGSFDDLLDDLEAWASSAYPSADRAEKEAEEPWIHESGESIPAAPGEVSMAKARPKRRKRGLTKSG